jgi:hypothetical protein
MDDASALEAVIKYLFTPTSSSAIPADAVAQLATSRAGMRQLAALSATLTGESTTLVAAAALLLTCQECLAQLDDFVAAATSGDDPTGHWPLVAHHLQGCPSCHEEYTSLVEILHREINEDLGAPPTFANFAQWQRTQRQAESTPNLWTSLDETTVQLRYSVALLLAQTRLGFDQLAASLQPHLVTAPGITLRNLRQPGELTSTALHLPYPASQLDITISPGPVVAGEGTLVVKIEHLTTRQPIAEAKISLRDGAGALLETNPTDADGLVYVRELAPGYYSLTIERQGEAPVVIVPFHLAASVS